VQGEEQPIWVMDRLVPPGKALERAYIPPPRFARIIATMKTISSGVRKENALVFLVVDSMQPQWNGSERQSVLYRRRLILREKAGK